MPAAARTILFWLLMAALAVVLWKISSSGQGGNAAPGSSMSYSDFMAQVDKNNVASIRLAESPATAEVHGQLRQPPDKFQTTVPKETIPALTEELRKQGVPIDVSEVKTTGWIELIINLSPFVVILAIWIFMIRRMRPRLSPGPPAESTASTIPTNRPLG